MAVKAIDPYQEYLKTKTTADPYQVYLKSQGREISQPIKPISMQQLTAPMTNKMKQDSKSFKPMTEADAFKEFQTTHDITPFLQAIATNEVKPMAQQAFNNVVAPMAGQALSLGTKAQDVVTNTMNATHNLVAGKPQQWVPNLSFNELQKRDVGDFVGKLSNIDENSKSNKPNYGQGNIDLNNRPIIHNPDGSISTVYSMTFTNDDGSAILLPGVRQGLDRKMTTQEALDWYKKTGEYLGKFKNEQEADKYAETLHENQAKQYDNKPTVLGTLGKIAGGIINTAGELITDPLSYIGVGEAVNSAKAGKLGSEAYIKLLSKNAEKGMAGLNNVTQEVKPFINENAHNTSAENRALIKASVTRKPEQLMLNAPRKYVDVQGNIVDSLNQVPQINTDFNMGNQYIPNTLMLPEAKGLVKPLPKADFYAAPRGIFKDMPSEQLALPTRTGEAVNPIINSKTPLNVVTPAEWQNLKKGYQGQPEKLSNILKPTEIKPDYKNPFNDNVPQKTIYTKSELAKLKKQGINPKVTKISDLIILYPIIILQMVK